MSDRIPKNQIKSVNTITQAEHEDSADARRVVSVDKNGNFIDEQHPLAVRLSDGSINVETLNANLVVQLSAKDDDPTLGDVHDSVRIGNGTYEVGVNADGSINVGRVVSSVLPDGAATEAKQDVGNTSLAEIEEELDTVNTSLTQIDSDLSAFKTANHTDLVSIKSDIDSTNTKLDTLHSDNVTVESKLDTVNLNLGTIDTDLGSFKSANHSDLTTLHNDLVIVETKQDTGNTSLAGIKTDLDEIALDTDKLDVNLSTRVADTTLQSTNTKLDTVHADLVVIEGKQDTGNTTLAAIKTDLDEISLDTDKLDVNLSTRATEATLAAFESANHTDLLGVQSRQDSGNTTLAAIKTDLDEISLDTDNLALIKAKTDNIDVALSTRAADATLASTNTKLDTVNTHLTTLETYVDGLEALIGTTNTEVGATNETSPGTDTAVSGLNGRLQRIAQRLTTLDSDLNTFSSANHTDLLAVKSDIDSTNTKLDTLHSDNVTVEGKLDTGNTTTASINSKLADDYGVSSAALRVASQIGNTTGQADFNYGATGAQTLRTSANLSDGSGNKITSDVYGTTRNLNVIIGDSYQRDGWGRVRVADTDLIESLHFANGAHPLLIINKLTGSGTAAFNSATSSIRLTNTTSSSDSVIVQTKRYFRYNPGRSYMVTLSGNFGAKKTNVQQRGGYFDTNNGLFFQQDQTNLSVVVRTNSSGSPVDTVVNQSSWNIDKLDGTGASGVTLDTSKHNLYIIDFLWHGAGRIRFGIISKGTILYCHEVLGSNNSASPYMRTPSLPLRMELNNTGTAGSTTTLDLVCFAFQKESSDSIGAPYQFSASTGRSSTTVGSTALPIISIRPKATFNALTNRVPIEPQTTSAVSSSQAIIISIVLNPTLTGASFASADTNSAAEFDIAATAVSGGTVIKQFYVAASSSLSTSNAASFSSAVEALILGLDIAGTTQDVVCVTAQSTAGNTNVFAQIDWQEFQ